MSLQASSSSATQGWLFGWFSRWATKEALRKSQDGTRNRADSEDWSEWEWVMSPTEEFLNKHAQWQMQRTETELDLLRGNSQFRLRPRFLQCATQVISSLTPQDVSDLQNSLDSAKRSKVIADTMKQCETAWKHSIKESFFDNTPYADKWNKFDLFYSEQPYSKNTIGVLKEVGWQASHGQNGTLTTRVLADITWSVWNALRGSIRGALDRELSQEELVSVADVVCRMQSPLVGLWLETLRNSRAGSAREGQLVDRWKREDAERRAKLEALIKAGKVDGRWMEPTRITLKPWEHARNREEVSSMLQNSLVFRGSQTTVR